MVEQDEGRKSEPTKDQQTDTVAPAQPESNVASNSSKAHEENAKRPKDWEERHSTLQLWFNALVATASLLGFGVALYQIREGRIATKLESRAWIGIGRGSTASIKLNDSVYFKIRLINYGQTPARDVTTEMRTIRIKKGFPLQPTYTPDSSTSGGAVLHPDSEVWMVVGPGTLPLTAEALADLYSGAVTLYVYGRVAYEDVFGDGHVMTFCMLYRMEDGVDGLKPCATHNTAD